MLLVVDKTFIISKGIPMGGAAGWEAFTISFLLIMRFNIWGEILCVWVGMASLWACSAVLTSMSQGRVASCSFSSFQGGACSLHYYPSTLSLSENQPLNHKSTGRRAASAYFSALQCQQWCLTGTFIPDSDIQTSIYLEVRTERL